MLSWAITYVGFGTVFTYIRFLCLHGLHTFIEFILRHCEKLVPESGLDWFPLGQLDMQLTPGSPWTINTACRFITAVIFDMKI